MALCVDDGSEFIEDGNENPFFADGEPSEQLQSALNFCERFQRDFTQTTALVTALSESGVLVTKELSYQSEDGNRSGLSGFRIVEEQKLNELGDETFLDWRKKGWLGVIYAHLVSLSTVPDLARRLG